MLRAVTQFSALTIARLLGIPYTVQQSAVAVPLTGSTSETTLATVTIPGGAIGPTGRCIITTLWSYTNSANNKTLKVRFGGTNYMNIVVGATAAYQNINIIRNITASSQKAMPSGAAPFGASGGAIPTSSVDTTADITVLFTVQLANSGEIARLEGYSVEVVYGA